MKDNRSGTYLLIFECRRDRPVAVGRLGTLRLTEGIYVYVGSAFGPGGVRARVARHRARSRRPHWHVDYIKPHCTLSEVWVEYSTYKRETAWARILANSHGASIPLVGFGASDAPNDSHLFYFRSRSALNRILNHAGRIAPLIES